MKLQRLCIYYFALAMVYGLSGITKQACAQRDSASVREMLEQRDEEIKELLGPEGTEYTQEQREQLKDIINGVIDYASMARFALQTTYDTLSAGQRKEFVDLFASIVRDQSLSKLDIYRADVTYNTISVTGDSAIVHTMAQVDKVRTPVTYEMYYDDQEQQWVVTDLIIDDVSTADSYRMQFQRIIRQRGYDYLLETLRKRASE